MGTKFKKAKKTFTLFVILTFVMSPSALWAKDGFDIYFLGVNLKTFQGSNWMKIAVGAAASILTHELGHALYLESQGKDWSVEPSSAGFAVTTTDSLTDKEYRGLGRSGYLLQTGIGLLLTSFDATAKSDFTKGWTGINVVQTLTYKLRGHNGYDDFAMIERGQGNGESSYRLFTSMSIYNFLKANSETGSVIYDISGFQDKKRPVTGENPTFQLNDEPNSLVFSVDTEISPSLSFDLFAKSRTQSLKKEEKQSLAFLLQEPLRPGI
ncbi:MAG: hypothetical protein JW896_11090 [Deltaproteobacteria bacterium]|nr:hypothetical protein [Deltaproteobacteria bacterium]